ncbi:MAG: hypothetical protein IPN29_03260 [Saprospiraceae bacterium]|nr:hypothetical protein [Saprospiraceae bacterium]
MSSYPAAGCTRRYNNVTPSAFLGRAFWRHLFVLLRIDKNAAKIIFVFIPRGGLHPPLQCHAFGAFGSSILATFICAAAHRQKCRQNNFCLHTPRRAAPAATIMSRLRRFFCCLTTRRDEIASAQLGKMIIFETAFLNLSRDPLF